MSATLQQIVDEVVGAAEADPENGTEICLDAANRMREQAMQPGSDRIAVGLAHWADILEATSHKYKRQGRATKDDFEELELQHAQAHREVGHLDDLEILARRNQIQAAEKAEEGTASSVIPKSVVGSTRLGNSATVKFNPTDADIKNNIVQSSTVLLWQGLKTETQSATIDIGIPVDPNIVPGTSLRPYAIVQYGADGYAQHTIPVDVGFGTRLTVSGNYVSVLVGMDPPRAGFPSGILTIGASLGFYAAPSLAPVTRTVYIDALGAGATIAFRRPTRAQVLLSIGMVGASAGTVAFFDSAGIEIESYSFSQLVVNAVRLSLPIPNDTYEIRLKNDGSTTKDFRLLFQLAL